MRAEPGDQVTLAKFQLNPKCRIADLTFRALAIDPLGHEDLKYALNHSALLEKFAQTLSRPIRSGDSELEYVPTQYLAEFFRLKGFDGLCFDSSLCTGKNIVLFDPENAVASGDVEHITVSKKILYW